MKSRSISNFNQPEATSFGKVYFTQYCFSSGGEARPKDHLQFEINPWQLQLFCAGKNYILQSNLWAKTRAEHGTNGTDEKQNLLSKKEKNFNNSEVINLILFPTLTPDDKQWILNYIDEFIINELNIKKEQLPWLNGKRDIEEWRNLAVMLRLSVAKIFSTYFTIKKKEELN